VRLMHPVVHTTSQYLLAVSTGALKVLEIFKAYQKYLFFFITLTSVYDRGLHKIVHVGIIFR